MWTNADSNSRSRERVAALCLLAVFLLVGGAAVGRAAENASAAPGRASADASAFSAANATLLPDGRYELSWTATVPKVVVIATTAASGVGGFEVATGRGRDSATIGGLATGVRWYFKLVAKRHDVSQDALVIATRSLNVTTMPNSRDFGGYRTATGGWTRYGVVFRGDQFTNGDATAIQVFSGLGLTTNINLMSLREQQAHPDPQLPGVANVRYSLLADSDMVFALEGAGGLTPEEQKAGIDAAGGPSGLEFGVWANMAQPYAVSQLRQVFAQIVAAHGAPVFTHDSGGTEREGVVIYLLDRILGVSDKDAVRDYMLSAQYNAARAKSGLAYFQTLGYTAQEAAPLVLPRPANIRAMLTSIETIYGSLDSFIRNGLGLTASDVAQLKSDLTTG